MARLPLIDPETSGADTRASFDSISVALTETLREKYRIEREKRLRADGNAQYIEVAGKFAHYLDDPWAKPNVTRQSVRRDVEVLVVGGGFGGLLSAARLRQAGIDDILMVEKGSDFGGTWYWNRYPGAACDTESYIYLPLLEDTGYIPTRKYVGAPEIKEHACRIGRHFDLYDRALFQTVVTDMRWDEAETRWLVATDRGDKLSAQFVILAGGPLNVPKLPGIPGVESFRGQTFHTSRWDYGYTGGDASGGLVGLADKRVGIIGTGATAVQCIPHLGEGAKELFVFQRTPSSVDVRNDSPTDQAWVSSLSPGWQRERMDNFTAVISGEPFDIDLVNDGWTDLIGGMVLTMRRAVAEGERKERPEVLIEQADFQKMERVRARVDSIVRDQAAADALKPWYNAFCKRPCFHDQYLQTFNRPNVHLVDTEGRGVERITEHGVVVSSREYELDCLIFATGFEVGTGYTHRIGFEVHGRDGLTLTEKWKDGVETFHGLFVRSFPNCFLITTTQSGQSPNFQHLLDEQSKHIAYVLSEARARGTKTVEVMADAETAWVEEVVSAAKGRLQYLQACTPGYYNFEGAEIDERTAKNGPYWRGALAFFSILEQWRREGTLSGLEMAG